MNMRGLKCPLPALRARKALSGMAKGDVLVIECTDPLTAVDIPNLLNQTGDALASFAMAYAARTQSDYDRLLKSKRPAEKKK